jgi:CRISPR-associated protein Cas2
MLVVISYDIVDDDRRDDLATLLKSYGNRVQYSVFEAHLTETSLSTLRAKVRDIIQESEDSVRYYKLGENYKERIVIDGVGVVLEKPEFLIS